MAAQRGGLLTSGASSRWLQVTLVLILHMLVLISAADLSDKDSKLWSGELPDSVVAEGSLDSADKRDWEQEAGPGQEASLLSADKEDAKRKWGNNMKVWGKRGGVNHDDKRAWNNNLRVWGKRADGAPLEQEAGLDDKRSWNSDNLRVWGKRDGPGAKKWGNINSMKVWGKRTADAEADKRAWDSNMRVWGKRTADGSLESLLDDKRAWDSNMRVWGKRADLDEEKRAWDNNLKVWGKRGSTNDEQVAPGVDKKAWDSNMRVWGKRSVTKRSVGDASDELTNDDYNKRAWDTGSMRVWGKRRNGSGGPKRNWQNNMRVWGKRSALLLDGDDSVADDQDQGLFYPDLDKKSWGSQLRTWGKRNWESANDQQQESVSPEDLLAALRQLYGEYQR